jgi:predicted RNA-binding Zn ribbon-like protein
VVSTEDIAQAPDGLDLVIDFVNTLDIDEGTDALATRKGLGGWMAERGLTRSSAPRLSDSDRAQAIRLREALRTLMLVNNGAAPDDGALRELERAARRGELAVHFSADGAVSLAPQSSGFAGALAQLLIPVARAIDAGSWPRVKACRAPNCQWVFYDRSRNRSGVWCDMAVCGNRTKVRAYRERA